MILFLRFRRATLLLTRGMGGGAFSLRHQQTFEATIGVRGDRRLAQVALALGMLLGQDVPAIRPIAPQLAGSRQVHAFAERALRLLFGHECVPVVYFGASTIDILRPS